nr:UPF0481 protein At3g47200-like [Ipomoea batatas]
MQSNTEAVCRSMKERLKDPVATITQHDRCCIFKVHDQLRNVNEKCYLPEIMSIGPYHHGQQSLQWIEPHKLRYLNSLLQWNRVSLEKLVNAIMEHESHLREYYAETIDLDQVKFTEMVVLDGCFVIELVRKFNMAELRDKDDPIFKMDWVLSSLQRDLILFENQLPFSVLCKLFDLIEAPNQHDRLIYLLCGFLTENGVKLRRSEMPKQISQFNIEFKHGVLWIPTLTIEDRTECVLRNLMAYEQYSKDLPQYFVTNYVKFFSGLIDSPRDVEILRRYGVIDNWLGGSEENGKSTKSTKNRFRFTVVGEENGGRDGTSAGGRDDELEFGRGVRTWSLPGPMREEMEEAAARSVGVDGGVVYNGSAFAVNNGSSFQDLYKQAAFCYEELILSHPLVPLYHLAFADTAVAVGVEPDNKLPYNEYYEYFGPDYTLHVEPHPMENQNFTTGFGEDQGIVNG